MDHKVNRVLSVTGSWVLKGDTRCFSSVTFYIAYPLVAGTPKSVLFYLLLATIIRPTMGNFMINIVRVVESRGWNLCFPGLLQYSHEKGEKGGSLSFKFNLVDPEGNKLIDQSFFISVLGRVPTVLHYPQHSNQGFHSVERKECNYYWFIPLSHTAPTKCPEYELCWATFCTVLLLNCVGSISFNRLVTFTFKAHYNVYIILDH